MAITEDEKKLKRLEKERRELVAISEKQELRLNNLQSSAFKLANYYFVFQGVILTIICSGSETTLKKSDRWFLFTLSIIAVVLNSIALIKTGIEFIDTRCDRYVSTTKVNSMYSKIRSLEDKIYPPELNIQSSTSNSQARAREREKKKREGYTYLAIYMFFFLGFAAVVLVGCWKFLGTQNEDGFNLLSNDKCIRLCNGAKCLNICSEYRYSSKIQASPMHDKF